METLGNESLMERRKIGFFASSKIASLSVLPTLDWAAEVAKQADVAVVSCFQSTTEREALDFLLHGRCGIIVVLPRVIYKKIPIQLQEAFSADRILLVAPVATKATRVSRYLCQKSNAYIASLSDELVFSSLSPESSLNSLVDTSKPLIKL